MSYNYEIAKDVLSATDKDRIVCLYLHCQPQAIDWEKAAKAFGSASADSMRVMARGALKKIEKAGGKEGVKADAVKAAPVKTTPRGKKRKDAAEGDDEESTPVSGKKRKGKKTTVAPKMDTDVQADGNGEVEVKGEDEDENGTWA